MGPKKPPKKTKAEIEAERLAKEEEERKQKILEEKRQAELAEQQRIEALKIEAERQDFRIKELSRLHSEYDDLLDRRKDKESQLKAEKLLYVSWATATAALDWQSWIGRAS